MVVILGDNIFKEDLSPYIEEFGRQRRGAKLLLKRDDFAYYSMSGQAWVVDPGEFEISVGPSSRDLLLKQTLQIK